MPSYQLFPLQESDIDATELSEALLLVKVTDGDHLVLLFKLSYLLAMSGFLLCVCH